VTLPVAGLSMTSAPAVVTATICGCVCAIDGVEAGELDWAGPAVWVAVTVGCAVVPPLAPQPVSSAGAARMTGISRRRPPTAPFVPPARMLPVTAFLPQPLCLLCR
jgi:hypothetical protein